MKTSVSQFKRLLPALQHLAAFPNCKRGVICERHNLPLADVEAAIEDLRGPFRVLDSERLADVAGELGVALPPFSPEKPPAPPVPAKPPLPDPPRPVAPAPRRLHEDRAMPAPRRLHEDRAMPANEVRRPLHGRVADRADSYRRICAELLADPELREAEAARRVGIPPPTWAGFKLLKFGKGKIPPAKLQSYLKSVGAETSPVLTVPKAESGARNKRRRRSAVTAAPAPAGAAVVVRPHEAVAAHQSAIAGKSAVLSELLCAQLFGANTTHVVGHFRLELDVRLVPVSP